ncbi:MAG: glycosyltransferase family 4 protein [Pleurocapsa sp.]
MKKILIIATISDTLECFILPFVKHFRGLGWQVDGMAQGINNCDRCLAEFDRVWEVEWSRNPLDLKNFFVAAPRVKELVAQGNYDLVHVHTPVAAFVTRYALRNYRGKQQLQVFYTAHGFHFHPAGNPIKNTIFLGLEKLAGNWTDGLITINREDEAAAKKYRLLAPEKIHYTPGIGVDISYYCSDRLSEEAITKVREELQLESTDSLLLCIAEFIPRKRHSDIIHAFKKLNRSDIHLALAGDGDLQTNIEQLTVKLGLAKQVHFLGFRSDIPELITASHAVLLVSQQEGLPRSIMEALCLATPVIGTNIRGIRDLLADNCGLLVEVGDIEELARAMAWIVDNPDAAIQMGQRGKNQMADYDINNIVQLYTQLYDRALTTINN